MVLDYGNVQKKTGQEEHSSWDGLKLKGMQSYSFHSWGAFFFITELCYWINILASYTTDACMHTEICKVYIKIINIMCIHLQRWQRSNSACCIAAISGSAWSCNWQYICMHDESKGLLDQFHVGNAEDCYTLRSKEDTRTFIMPYMQIRDTLW